MTIDVSLIPQNRVENLISKLSEIENNIGNIGTDITNNVVHKAGNETINGTKTFTGNTNDSLKMIISNTSGKNSILRLRDSTTAYGDSGIDIFQATSNNFNQFLIHFVNGNQYPFHIDQDTSDSSIFNTYINNKRLASFVTTTYQSGTSWYRVWSDGWIEQGGQYGSWSNNPQLTISLNKAFTQTNYAVSVFSFGTTQDAYTGQLSFVSRTTSSFVVNTYTNDRGGISWIAMGY